MFHRVKMALRGFLAPIQAPTKCSQPLFSMALATPFLEITMPVSRVSMPSSRSSQSTAARASRAYSRRPSATVKTSSYSSPP